MTSLESHVGDVVPLKFPGNKINWRWITKRRSDGRYLGRPIKLGVRYGDAMTLKRNKDFGKESLIPEGTKLLSSSKKKKSKGTMKKRKTMKKKN